MKTSAVITVALAFGACVPRSTQAPVEGFSDKALPAYVYAGGPSGEIQIFRLDRIAATLAPHGSVPAGRSGALASDRQGHFLYAATDGEVTAFAIRAKNGSLQSLGRASAHGAGTNDLIVHRNGKYVLASNERTGNVVVFAVRPDGALGPAEPYGAGGGPQALALNPRLDFAFVLNAGGISQFAFNTGTGILTPSREHAVALPAHSNPARLLFHPTGKFAYVLEQGTGSIAGYAFEPTSGTLSVLAFQTLPIAGKAGKLRGGDLEIVPSGKFLYAVDRGHDTIAIFRVDPETGALAALTQEDSHGHQPRALAMTDGKLNPILLVAHEKTLSAFNVNNDTGAISHVQSVPLRGTPAAITVATVRD